jgi:pSer/pThr/pTyr-binding forkhead associated (FHA) protein
VAKLIVKDAGGTWLADLATGESATLGRSRDCELPVEAPRASRRHVAFVADGEGHRVRDLGSTNGTLLNGARLAGEVRLVDGDVVDAAGCAVVYRAGPA